MLYRLGELVKHCFYKNIDFYAFLCFRRGECKKLDFRNLIYSDIKGLSEATGCGKPPCISATPLHLEKKSEILRKFILS